MCGISLCAPILLISQQAECAIKISHGTSPERRTQVDRPICAALQDSISISFYHRYFGSLIKGSGVKLTLANNVFPASFIVRSSELVPITDYCSRPRVIAELPGTFVHTLKCRLTADSSLFNNSCALIIRGQKAREMPPISIVVLTDKQQEKSVTL